MASTMKVDKEKLIAAIEAFIKAADDKHAEDVHKYRENARKWALQQAKELEAYAKSKTADKLPDMGYPPQYPLRPEYRIGNTYKEAQQALKQLKLVENDYISIASSSDYFKFV